MRIYGLIQTLLCVVFINGCSTSNDGSAPKGNGNRSNTTTEFDQDVVFMKKYTQVVVLGSKESGRVALCPSLQGRVMTSTSPSGTSYGWINRGHFQSGDTLSQINVFGGEERFWLGPEGGQYSIFFSQGEDFEFENWTTPKLIDLEPFMVTKQTQESISFSKEAKLVNYSGFQFDFKINRDVSMVQGSEIEDLLSIKLTKDIEAVGYKTSNQLTNTGIIPWTKENGLLSIWLLGMFKPSSNITVVVPFKPGDESELGPKVVDDYFGKINPDRLVVTDSVIFFKGDGQERGKIGLKPQRAKGIMGSYDAINGIVTIVKYDEPQEETDYVNSKWEYQDEPYNGEVINSYNDGPTMPGTNPLGPFYELESSSPALALAPGDSAQHVQYTFHFEGSLSELDKITKNTLGVSIEEVGSVFHK